MTHIENYKNQGDSIQQHIAT